jgi:hypothetical protein
MKGARSCPWCRGTELWFWDKAVPGGFAVSCSNPECGATGPISRKSAEHALLLWNGREQGTSAQLKRVESEMYPPEAKQEA